jgi:hypothetical protein
MPEPEEQGGMPQPIEVPKEVHMRRRWTHTNVTTSEMDTCELLLLLVLKN